MMVHQTAMQHRWRNRVHTFLLLASLFGFFMVIARLILGSGFLLPVILLAAFTSFLPAALTPRILLRQLQARPLEPHQAPDVASLVRTLSNRAGLRHEPRLFLIAKPGPIAFTMGGGEHAVVVLSMDLLRSLSPRELAGVLAHEIGHIRNGDLLLLRLSYSMTGLVRLLSMAGLVLLFFSLPMLALSGTAIPWGLVLVLALAPQAMMLIQLALSRSREFDADLAAAELTGDPAGLARALQSLEYFGQGFWKRFLRPANMNPVPVFLRTHPLTAERIRRLQDLIRRRPDSSGPDPWPAALRHDIQTLGNLHY